MACVLFASSATAQSTVPPVAGDVELAVLLDESGPLVLRFEINADGKGFRALTREYVEQLFVYLDQDADGSLSGKEIARSNAWRTRLAPEQKPGQQPKVQGAPAGASKEERIARDEWVRELSTLGERVQFVSQAVAAAASQPLWTRLDRDSDGALNADELAATPATLGPLDVDDDEMITSEELVPYQPAGYGYTPAAPGAAAIQSLARDDAARVTLVREMFRRYDRSGRGGKAGNRRLEPQEAQLEQAVFDQADRDHDRALDRGELIEWLRNPPVNLIVAVRFGGGPNVMVVSAQEVLPRAAEQNADGSQTLSVRKLRLRFATAEMSPHPPDDKALEGQFRAIDRDGNGELDAGECQAQPYLKDELEFLDCNGDGKLSLEEALPYFRQQAALARSRIVITELDEGRVLYSKIDADHDGRLSVRELRAAASKLPFWDANGDGRLTDGEVPHQVRITVARGSPLELPPPGQPAGPFVMGPQNVAAGRGGPRWFQRMDRNGDGDLSLREFLPGAELFRKLDSDGDGLLDAREIERSTADRPAPRP
jgi:Ca2+-binding EF-hand superfamily protein